MKAISDRIRGCFGSVDLKFALHQSDKNRAKELRKTARESRLTRQDIEAAIEPKIRDWLENSYVGFHKPAGAMSDEQVKIEAQISKMVFEASAYISS